MKTILLKKLKESLISVLPVILIVLLINLTPLTSFTGEEIVTFIISAFFLIFGIGLFNIGADLAMTPMGEHIGSGLTKLRSIPLLLGVCFTMGVLITVAEPDLQVLADQVQKIMNGNLLVITVGLGVGLFLVLAVLKIIFKKPLSSLLMFFYMILFALVSILISVGGDKLIPMAFDSGGVTTGPITVPFIMALGVGIAATLGGKNASESSFGLIAMCSIGPILAVMLLSCFSSSEGFSPSPSYDLVTEPSYIFTTFAHVAKDIAIALGLIVLFFIILQLVCLKLPKKKIIQIAIGIIYTFIGLVLFLSAVEIGFMPIGYELGRELGQTPAALAIFAFVIGAVVVLAEPAVHVLNKQVEEITDGTVSRRSMTLALSIGVGLAICLSVIRIIFGFSILYYLIPGYLISLGLSFFVPGIYTGIAFDSGGVASGPLTSSFILPFAVGACSVISGTEYILESAFGVVALVALAPLITIQLLGFRSIVARRIESKIAMKRILKADDEQIIEFT